MTTTPGPGQARFPGFDVVAQSAHWDEVTTTVVLGRLRPSGAARFFTTAEEATVRALVDRLLAQDGEPRVPVFEFVDARLAERSGDGYRYHDMPDDPEAWRTSVVNLGVDAASRHHRPFSELARGQQLRLIEGVRTTKGRWHDLPAERIFGLWMRYVCTAFYSHPWAWNEIGFGGPAYPRGYKNLGFDRREPWEVAEGDATNPLSWAQRAEAARRRHRDALSSGEPS